MRLGRPGDRGCDAAGLVNCRNTPDTSWIVKHDSRGTERLTHDRMHNLVGTLACMHGQLWEDPAIKVIRTLNQYLERTTAMVALRARAAVGMERAAEEIPSDLLGRADRIFDATVRSMNIGANEMAQTLLHGDGHVGQPFVTEGGRMDYAYWQRCLRGAWACDLAYAVISACEPEDRREWEPVGWRPTRLRWPNTAVRHLVSRGVGWLTGSRASGL
ncbi:hypothetical protein HMPREF0591_1597 [Mycobacterium parascrofulaceum ATCC BAA-614]|uniref:Aminoglycoside phosphotransferase domain-containing protein n=2 Tax=Mycobacterium parascrofulaceum TaxID=240125 RepID=D5P603_9MYCO|nr:hypothetical protein HMPREF0591_1597 [Mycobacterium parascrofulaceum ATCC BAA-614]